jgi:hypothetical protein
MLYGFNHGSRTELSLKDLNAINIDPNSFEYNRNKHSRWPKLNCVKWLQGSSRKGFVNYYMGQSEAGYDHLTKFSLQGIPSHVERK